MQHPRRSSGNLAWSFGLAEVFDDEWSDLIGAVMPEAARAAGEDSQIALRHHPVQTKLPAEADFATAHWTDLTETTGQAMREFLAAGQPPLGLHIFVPEFASRAANLARTWQRIALA